MLHVIDYKENNIVSVGFKKHNFVVYGQIGTIEGFTKEQYLQKLYEQCKSAIDYETKLYKEGKPNSITTDKEGEEFIPEEPKLKSLKLKVDNNYIQFEEEQENVIVELSAIVRDQYSDNIDVDVKYSSNIGTIQNNILNIPKVIEYTEVIIIANAGDISDNETIYVYPYIKPEPKIVDEYIDEEKIAMAEAIIDLNNRISLLEGGK